MVADHVDARVLRLAEGFGALMEEYNILLVRSQGLERTLHEAKSQFQRFVAERGTVSAADVQDFEISETTRDIENPLRRQVPSGKWWMRTDLPMNKKSLLRTRYAVDAVQSLSLDKTSTEDAASKISSEVVVTGGSSTMPSIVESPLEQDFTSPGTPSRLDCPFASMTSRRLSAHAASVVSKYKANGVMTPRSAGSRIIGRAPTPKPAGPPSVEPGQEGTPLISSPTKPSTDLEASIQGSGPVCPIRFLDKNSPQQVAEYFEKHKHELPRSHEICVKRFGSSAADVRQLDAKYGDLVSMIQGLGHKHVPMLPGKEDGDDDEEIVLDDGHGAERVRQWADNVSNVAQVEANTPDEDERLSHFDRPMKDVRVGESPSRPWGIQVPLSAIEKAAQNEQEHGPTTVVTPGTCPFARGAHAGTLNPHVAAEQLNAAPHSTPVASKPVGKCPFAGGAPPGAMNPHSADTQAPRDTLPQESSSPQRPTQSPSPMPIFISDADGLAAAAKSMAGVTFTGPVLIGYNPEQAAAILRALGGNPT